MKYYLFGLCLSVLGLFGILFIRAGSQLGPKGPALASEIGIVLCSSFISAALIGALFDLSIRRDFMEKLREELSVKKAFSTSEIQYIWPNFLLAFEDFRDTIDESKSLYLFLTNGREFRRELSSTVKAWWEKGRCDIVICILDYETLSKGDKTSEEISEDFSIEPELMKEEIKETINFFTELSKRSSTKSEKSGSIRVYCHSERQPYAAYKIDSGLYIAPYFAHTAGQHSPMIRFRQGTDDSNSSSLKKKYSEDIDTTIEKSRLAFHFRDGKTIVDNL